jgi:hypothetical protein
MTKNIFSLTDLLLILVAALILLGPQVTAGRRPRAWLGDPRLRGGA